MPKSRRNIQIQSGTAEQQHRTCPKTEHVSDLPSVSHLVKTTHDELFRVVRCASSTPIVVSDESSEAPSRCTTPETGSYPDDLSEEKFLRMFGLVTHDAYDHLLVKRAERRKRNATKSQYFHSQIWDMPPARVSFHFTIQVQIYMSLLLKQKCKLLLELSILWTSNFFHLL